MLSTVILLLLVVWTGAIASLIYVTLPDKYLWIPVLLALAGVLNCTLPLVVAMNTALVANAATLILFTASLEVLNTRSAYS